MFRMSLVSYAFFTSRVHSGLDPEPADKIIKAIKILSYHMLKRSIVLSLFTK